MLRRLGSYVDASVVSILTMRPSQPSLMLSSRKAEISSVLDPSDALAKPNSLSTAWKCSLKISRRSRSSFCSRLCTVSLPTISS